MIPTNEDIEKQLSFVEWELRRGIERYIGEEINSSTINSARAAMNEVLSRYDYYGGGQFKFHEWIELECRIHPDDPNQLTFTFYRKK